MVLFIIQQLLEETQKTQKPKVRMLSITAFAKKHGVHRNTIIRWIKTGQLEATQTPGGHWRIDAKAEPTYK